MEGLHTGENIGGILEISICHIDDLEDSRTSIIFKPNRWWIVISTIPNTASLVDDEIDTDHGILFNYSGGFRRQYPSRSDELIFEKFLGQCCVVRVIDNNGICRILGRKDLPVSLTRTGNRGAKPSDLSYHEFKFSISQPFRAL